MIPVCVYGVPNVLKFSEIFRALELMLLLLMIIDVSVVAVIDGYNGESLGRGTTVIIDDSHLCVWSY